MKLKLAYFGTPDFSAQFLERLVTDPEAPGEVVLVVTQPDKKVGRKQLLTKSAVKIVAEKHSLPTFEFSKTTHYPLLTTQLKDVDLALVYAFGEIIPAALLNIPKFGFWNVHPSLLPKYRGASPMATPLMHGDTQTGVTLIKMDEKVDHGPIIAQKTAPIGEKDRRPQLEERLTAIGYELFKKSLSELATEFIITHEQDHSQATFTKRLTKHDGFIESSQFAVHSSQEAHEIFNKFRGLYPWPGIWTVVKTKGKEQRLKIKDMDLENGKLLIKKVQLEGKKEVAFETFKRAYGESLL